MKMVIFHGKLLNNQRVNLEDFPRCVSYQIMVVELLKTMKRFGVGPGRWHSLGKNTIRNQNNSYMGMFQY